MNINVYGQENYCTGQWAGGTTTQLAIYPEGADYASRDFCWRLSSAEVEWEESDFTPLPDYDRVLIVLKGEVVLAHRGIRALRLAQYEQDRFSGGYRTRSYGKITDFNLMYRKGSQGFAEAIRLTAEYQPLAEENFEGMNRVSHGFYCAEGFCTVEIGGEIRIVREGQLCIANCVPGESGPVGAMGEGRLIHTHVYFFEGGAGQRAEREKGSGMPVQDAGTDQAGAESAATSAAAPAAASMESKQEGKGGAFFSDWQTAAFLCWTNFRGSQYLFKGLQGVWFDEALQKGIRRLECIFLPFLLCFAGLGAIGFYLWESHGGKYLLPALAVWVAVDFFIISPLLYYLSLPKPVKPHIKKLEELTEAEAALREKQLSENKRADKILKKYEITGRNKYID